MAEHRNAMATGFSGFRLGCESEPIQNRLPAISAAICHKQCALHFSRDKLVILEGFVLQRQHRNRFALHSGRGLISVDGHAASRHVLRRRGDLGSQAERRHRLDDLLICKVKIRKVQPVLEDQRRSCANRGEQRAGRELIKAGARRRLFHRNLNARGELLKQSRLEDFPPARTPGNPP